MVRDLGEKLVLSGGVAERVVDLLEAVEIEQEQLARPVPVRLQRLTSSSRPMKQGAIGKACKWIVVGELFQLAVSLANFIKGFIEGCDESPDFVVAGGLDPRIVVMGPAEPLHPSPSGPARAQ